MRHLAARALASAALLLSAACGCGILGHSAVAIEGGPEGDGIVFRFSECGWVQHEVPKDSVAVMRAGQTRRSAQPICEIKSSPLDKPPLRRWKYGSAPPGFEVTHCEPLRPGRYRIFIVGTGYGTREFTVLADGSFQWATAACP